MYIKRGRENNEPVTRPASAVRIQISKDLHRFLRILEPRKNRPTSQKISILYINAHSLLSLLFFFLVHLLIGVHLLIHQSTRLCFGRLKMKCSLFLKHLSSHMQLLICIYENHICIAAYTTLNFIYQHTEKNALHMHIHGPFRNKNVVKRIAGI